MLKPAAKLFFQISHVGTGPQAPGPSPAVFTGTCLRSRATGTGIDAHIGLLCTGRRFTYYATILAPYPHFTAPFNQSTLFLEMAHSLYKPQFTLHRMINSYFVSDLL